MTHNAEVQMVRMETFAKFPYLIAITYEENGHRKVLRLANTDQDVVYGGVTYAGAYFQITPPTRTNSSISDGKITFSTIDQTWIERVRNQQGKMTCEFIACISYDDNNEISGFEEIERIKFTMKNAGWNDKTIQFTLMFDDKMNLVVPCCITSPDNTPALA